MPTIDIHATESAVLHLAGLIEDRAARCGGEYDPELDELEREFAELRWQLGHA
jgi:hypothetical protein